MANLIDIKDDSRATAQNLVDYLQKPKGWFAYEEERFNAGFNGHTSIEQTALAAAIDVYNNGKPNEYD